jgi:hypothetical protein
LNANTAEASPADAGFYRESDAAPPATAGDNHATPGERIENGADSDPLEAALVRALEVASAAGDLDRIDRIVAELRERRQARAGVPALAEARARRERTR